MVLLVITLEDEVRSEALKLEFQHGAHITIVGGANLGQFNSMNPFEFDI